ncbi:MAG TPA: phytoene desaturase family protein [Ktedonobacteraceae bacterium]|jgi:diapolycopene oxygenase|nr:phytoene desaturase family protein [Ktedonobacteraceae bacterium]
MSDHAKRIIVIGAGIGGLSAAIRLAAQGHRVSVFERQPTVGGKLNQVVMDGFSFDTGPSLITMPHVLQNLFQAAGRRMEDYIDLVPLDITCRYFYRDGLILNAWCDHTRLVAEFSGLNDHDGEALYRFLAYTSRLYQAAADPFLYHSLGSPLDVLRSFVRYVFKGHDTSVDGMTVQAQDYKALLSLNSHTVNASRISRLRAVLSALSPATLDQCIRGFFKDEHLHQLFDRYATYNGSSPYQVAAVYSIIPYVELAEGGWYLRGGIYTLASALERLARELGVSIETSSNVRRILVEHGAAQGVVLDDGQVVRSDVVIANSDVVTTHRELLSPVVRNERLMHRLEHVEPSCSGFVLLLGVNKQYPQLAHHNIFFSDNYRAEFDDLFVKRIPLQNPTIYVCVTTRTDPSQAPEGHENLFVLVNAPYLTADSNWECEAQVYRNHILDLLASYFQIDLKDVRDHIVCEAIITPEDFKRKYGANRGSIYGLSSNQRMAPFTRPGNRSKEIRNLYFVGGSTHPGGGVPLVMLSGKIVAELVQEQTL